MNGPQVLRVFRFVALGLVAVAIFGFVLMSLWNWLIPPLTGWHAPPRKRMPPGFRL